jgi:hypothetical protein
VNVLNEIIDKWWPRAQAGDEEAVEMVVDLMRVKMALVLLGAE